MGVLNVTPDSFFDGGKHNSLNAALAQARKMVAEGTNIIDIGAESSRPGAEPVSEQEELDRVLPIIAALVQEIDIPISIDTYKPAVAKACLEAGATIVNDISGLRDTEMISVVAEHQAQVVIMHMQGEPRHMQKDPQYDDVIGEIKAFFEERIAAATAAGIKKENIILDPGIGFGKKNKHNLTILKNLNEFCDLGYELLIGTSRKSFIGRITGAEVEDRLPGSLASIVSTRQQGASIFRVHDVAATKQALMIADAIENV